MRSEQAWALLTARAMRYDRVAGGHAHITQADAAALLAGLARRPFLTAMLVDVGDENVHHELFVNLRDYTYSVARRDVWKAVRPIMFDQVPLLAIFELAGRGNPCEVCDGSGSVPIEAGSPSRIPCEACRGTGKAPMTARERSALLKLHESNWSRTWGDRYEIIFGELHGWLTDARRHMARKLRKESRAAA